MGERSRRPNAKPSAALGRPGAGGGKDQARVVEKRFFHNTCLLVKLMLSDSQEIDNVPINELYDEARACHVHAVGVRDNLTPRPSAAGVRAARADRRLAEMYVYRRVGTTVRT